ncbi:hypothetical protein PHYSODRAFT_323000 [Phytophthora sojae]|uniref:Uncharacterized protein n=1 Tax=Phytophthora sojae (strain P6497) TaxID=1094619 RepID=G4YKZ4_PHYSP|nr:hypothetical protein PHYSODRAFT_323000 [Phytophthora sojae]EGZ29485.1 hypothetical protein PHYSODRAFT_323000 [Phytophthora sojae]|eukprot:XP_009516760.1 hypothetical protein PHYSODRAFT_323000 [Phytophthora sojae]
MGETRLDNEMEIDGEDGDDSYANAYLDDDDVQESDDAELAEMLAKVQSIQQVEGRLQLAEPAAATVTTDVKGGQGDEAKASARMSPRVTTVVDARKSQSLVKSPSAASSTSCVGVYKSQDGITTIPRSALNARNAGAGALLGIKKAAVYEEKLLQAVKTTNTIERLRQKAVAAAPGEAE